MDDWRTTRDALEAAYKVLGEDHPGSLPERDWNLATALREAFLIRSRYTCLECHEPIRYREEIVCLDCNAPLHKDCAPRHFWPNGRPDGSDLRATLTEMGRLADDPMWADHVELPKGRLRLWIKSVRAAIRSLSPKESR